MKKIVFLLFVLMMSQPVLAMTCSDDKKQNIAQAHRYIFGLKTPISTTSIQKEVIQLNTLLKKTNVISNESVLTMEYDKNGIMIKSYDVIYADGQIDYTEHIHKTESGWDSEEEDFIEEYKVTSQYVTDERGRIIHKYEKMISTGSEGISQSGLKSRDYIKNYTYSDNNCLAAVNMDETSEYEDGDKQTISSRSTFHYENDKLVKIINNNKTTVVEYEYDDKHRLIELRYISYSDDNQWISTTTEHFLNFNPQDDWISSEWAMDVANDKWYVDVVIIEKREITYYE